MRAMREDDVDEIVAQVRLRAALEAHIEATEPVPPEVGQAVREMYRERPTR